MSTLLATEVLKARHWVTRLRPNTKTSDLKTKTKTSGFKTKTLGLGHEPRLPIPELLQVSPDPQNVIFLEWQEQDPLHTLNMTFMSPEQQRQTLKGEYKNHLSIVRDARILPDVLTILLTIWHGVELCMPLPAEPCGKSRKWYFYSSRATFLT